MQTLWSALDQKVHKLLIEFWYITIELNTSVEGLLWCIPAHCLPFILQSMEITTHLMDLMDCWLMPTLLAKALEETLTLMRMNTGPKIHRVRISIIRIEQYLNFFLVIITIIQQYFEFNIFFFQLTTCL